jgi:hypothetical protein
LYGTRITLRKKHFLHHLGNRGGERRGERRYIRGEYCCKRMVLIGYRIQKNDDMTKNVLKNTDIFIWAFWIYPILLPSWWHPILQSLKCK